MATDNITGIRIGDNTYQEGLRYRNVELGLFLLPPGQQRRPGEV